MARNPRLGQAKTEIHTRPYQPYVVPLKIFRERREKIIMLEIASDSRSRLGKQGAAYTPQTRNVHRNRPGWQIHSVRQDVKRCEILSAQNVYLQKARLNLPCVFAFLDTTLVNIDRQRDIGVLWKGASVDHFF